MLDVQFFLLREQVANADKILLQAQVNLVHNRRYTTTEVRLEKHLCHGTLRFFV